MRRREAAVEGELAPEEAGAPERGEDGHTYRGRGGAGTGLGSSDAPDFPDSPDALDVPDVPDALDTPGGPAAP
ncbi:hypothetical protein SALBM135S_03279 [Streptomyces alboniger]